MTITKCDLCGRIIEKVRPGITYRGGVKAKDNNARIELVWQDGQDKHYDLCPDCSTRLVNMFERERIRWGIQEEEDADKE